MAEAVRGPADEAGVAVTLEIDDVPEITADSEALRRAFLNLALNAVQAMEVEGGSLTLAARSAESTEEGDDLGGSVRVSVRDTGPGIPEGERRKVFTPFWTTKRDGHGLGLALVHKTVTDHGGRIQLHSRAGVGTEFVVTLPVGELA